MAVLLAPVGPLMLFLLRSPADLHGGKLPGYVGGCFVSSLTFSSGASGVQAVVAFLAAFVGVVAFFNGTVSTRLVAHAERRANKFFTSIGLSTKTDPLLPHLVKHRKIPDYTHAKHKFNHKYEDQPLMSLVDVQEKGFMRKKNLAAAVQGMATHKARGKISSEAVHAAANAAGDVGDP